MQIFKSKTGNAFEDRANFQSKPGKYTLQHTERKSLSQRQHSLLKVLSIPPAVLDAKYTGALDATVAKLLFLLTDPSALVENMVKHSGFAVDIGVASSKALSEARALLDDLMDLVERRTEHQNAKPFPNYEAIKDVDAKITELTNRFYMLIPTDAPSVRKANTREAVARFDQALSSIAQQNVAANVLLAAYKNTLNIHPFDCMIKLIGANIRPLQPSDELETIKRYFHSTLGSATVELDSVYTVSRPTEDEPFKAHEDSKTRMLLWHGTKLTNVIGILKDGCESDLELVVARSFYQQSLPPFFHHLLLVCFSLTVFSLQAQVCSCQCARHWPSVWQRCLLR